MLKFISLLILSSRIKSQKRQRWRRMQIKEISIDLETYSPIDLSKAGVYRYVEDFEILLFGYSINGGEAKVIDLASGEKIPDEIINAIVDDSVIKWAHNASFERICLSEYIRFSFPGVFRGYGDETDSTANYLSPASWRCSLVWSAYLGLPLSLEGVGAVLNLSDKKLKEGKDLIRYFCSPCKPTIANGQRSRNLPIHDPEKWELFKKYNLRDVEVEEAIKARLGKYPVPESVWEEYHISENINDRGILVDIELAKSAIKLDKMANQELSEALTKLTNIDNPNSVVQIKKWLADNGLEMDSLGKKIVAETLKTCPAELREVLELRQQLSKSSVKKYEAMINSVCKDNRARGMFQFYGAARTGRWAGRRIQLQNLPQNHLPDLEQARELVKLEDYDTIKLLYNDVPDTLSQLIRTSFISKPGYKFVVSDFSAIEARVLSFLAGEQWRIEVFSKNGDIYCASASKMFKVPVEKHGINSHLRQKGKVAELALGYGLSIGGLKAMGALDMGMKEEELKPLVDAWRAANTSIVNLWWDVDYAVKHVIVHRSAYKTHGLVFSYKNGMLFIELPSGRRLSYVKPKIELYDDGRESITYEGSGVNKKWERIESYGPKFIENIVQALSRDILAESMKRLKDCYIVGHVHDELIIEVPTYIQVEDISKRMALSPSWMKEICLNADGYETLFYKKD